MLHRFPLQVCPHARPASPFWQQQKPATGRRLKSALGNVLKKTVKGTIFIVTTKSSDETAPAGQIVQFVHLIFTPFLNVQILLSIERIGAYP
jgi:hypothetical protein